MALDTIFIKETVKEEDKLQKIYAFPNGYGASVIQGKYINRGNLKLWEIAPWRNDTQEFIGQNGLGWGDDVRGYLTDSEINEILKQVSELTDADVFCEWNCGDTVEDCTGYKCWIR